MSSNNEQQKPQNNLKELNDVFFDTMRGLIDGSVDDKKANTVATLGTAIINNAKVQLQGYKLTNGRTNISALPQGEQVPVKKQQLNSTPIRISKKEDEAQLQYARSLGYENAAEAIVTLPKGKFLADFNTWYSTLIDKN